MLKSQISDDKVLGTSNNNNKLFTPETALGVKDFRSLIENSTVIVDKSLLIKKFLDDKDETILITYPRRWGKTINMSMIKTFFELEIDTNGNIVPEEQRCNINIFALGKWVGDKKEPLNIWHKSEIVERFFGKYPVIYLSFKGLRGNSYYDIELKTSEQLSILYKAHKYLLGSDRLDTEDKNRIKQYINVTNNIALLEGSLKHLSEYLAKHFNQQVFILIDEYDTSINDANLSFKDAEEIDKTVRLFRGILGGALKENAYLKKGLITGIYRIAKADLFSGVNNLGEYNILDREYAPYYGFTKEEVDQLLKQYNVATNLETQLKEWYNGYRIGGLEIYNPWSIIKCLNKINLYVDESNVNIEKEILQSYWEESGNVSFILKLLTNKLIKTYVERLIDNQPITFDLQRQLTMDNFTALRNFTNFGSNYKITTAGVNLLFSYLFFGGYLTVYELPALFVLPNKEIHKEMSNRLLEYYQAEYTIDTILFQNVTDKVQVILDKKLDTKQINKLIEEFRLALEDLLKALPEFVNLTGTKLVDNKASMVVHHGNEDLIHSVLNYIILQVKTLTRFATEISIGRGKADIAFIDGQNACAAIIEIKYDQNADIALEQINSRSYAHDIINIYNTILIGVNVLPDKSVQIKHSIKYSDSK